jgi:hypothetical protein
MSTGARPRRRGCDRQRARPRGRAPPRSLLSELTRPSSRRARASTSSAAAAAAPSCTELGATGGAAANPARLEAPPSRGIGARAPSRPTKTEAKAEGSKGEGAEEDGLEALLAAHNSKANAAAQAKAAARVAGGGKLPPLAPVPRNSSRPNGGGASRGAAAGKGAAHAADLNAAGCDRVQGASTLTTAPAQPPARARSATVGGGAGRGADEAELDALLRAHNASATVSEAPRVHAMQKTVPVKAMRAWERREGRTYNGLSHEEREAVTQSILANGAR